MAILPPWKTPLVGTAVADVAILTCTAYANPDAKVCESGSFVDMEKGAGPIAHEDDIVDVKGDDDDPAYAALPRAVLFRGQSNHPGSDLAIPRIVRRLHCAWGLVDSDGLLPYDHRSIFGLQDVPSLRSGASAFMGISGLLDSQYSIHVKRG
ncbi:hypothetical protein B0H10DRAFT_2206187 [Mycena sp. CBHHK59/15]|nr:hypothetical protein B0H10DRAFT_2206187 [Mycena sp. CBHHK59/15]